LRPSRLDCVRSTYIGSSSCTVDINVAALACTYAPGVTCDNADLAAHRRHDVRVAEIDLRGVDSGFARSDIRRGLALSRHCVVVVLLADRVGRDQHLVAAAWPF
jgi:hypothetical protein